MKKILTIFAVCAALCGCIKTESDADKVSKTAIAVGKAAAYAANYVADKDTMTTIVTVVDKIQAVIPETNQTFVSAWSPIINEEFAKLVQAGKLNAGQAELAKAATVLAAEGVDYLFKANPKWKQSTDIYNVAVKGVIDGFKSVVQKKASLSSADQTDEYDKDAYNYFLSKIKK